MNKKDAERILYERSRIAPPIRSNVETDRSDDRAEAELQYCPANAHEVTREEFTPVRSDELSTEEKMLLIGSRQYELFHFPSKMNRR